MKQNRLLAALLLLVAALTVSAQKKVDFSVRTYWDFGKSRSGSGYYSDRSFEGGLGLKADAMYRILPGLKVGGGLGVEIKDMISYGMKDSKTDKNIRYHNDEFTLLPVFLKGKYNFLRDSKFSPFISVEAGIEFVVKEKDESDDFFDRQLHYYAMPAVGVDWNISKKTRVFLQAGFMMMSVPYYIYWFQYSEDKDKWDKPDYKHDGVSCWEVSLGVEF